MVVRRSCGPRAIGGFQQAKSIASRGQPLTIGWRERESTVRGGRVSRVARGLAEWFGCIGVEDGGGGYESEEAPCHSETGEWISVFANNMTVPTAVNSLYNKVLYRGKSEPRFRHDALRWQLSVS